MSPPMSGLPGSSRRAEIGRLSERAIPVIAVIRVTAFMECRLLRASASLRLDVSRLNDLAPLLNTFKDEVAEIGRTHRHRDATEVGKPRLYPRIGKSSGGLLVELPDDLHWRILRRADAAPRTGLVARHKITNRREVRQCIRACRCRHRQRTKLAGPDVRD